ncbi:MAG: large subunit ribosomal protein [Patescibacteria group bacterium]|nr:large subunit ribosomal protein [Patescibacteria group bacterium]
MALSKAKKVDLVAQYENALKNSQSAVYVNFKGLRVGKQEELRKKLFAENLNYTVVKKTLWERATKTANIQGDSPVIDGEMAVLWGNDLLSPARIANEFAKANKKAISILGGIFEGNFKDASEMMDIATIPSRETLLSQIAFLLKSPVQRIAIGINEVAKTKN